MRDNTIRILVVDDDPGLLAVLECGLSQNPEYWVKAVDNASRALRELEAGGWDLVVTDYLLNHPEIDGIRLLRAAYALPQPPLVVMITAFASLQITLESINLGAHNFLTKPFQMDELFLVVRNAASLIRLGRENQRLHGKIAAMAAELEDLQRAQQALLEQLSRLEYEGSVADPSDTNPGALLNTAQAMELRRRRMRDKVSAYAKTGEQIALRIERQRGIAEDLSKKHAAAK